MVGGAFARGGVVFVAKVCNEGVCSGGDFAAEDALGGLMMTDVLVVHVPCSSSSSSSSYAKSLR